MTLRYLFVYTGYENVSVEAKSLKLQTYRNDTTIIGMEPVSQIAPELLIVTSDNYAWDIEELVGLIQSKHGIFINGYTRLGFAPQDVQAIINHSSGKGKPLKKLEATNAALRKRIPHDVYQRLWHVGQICIAERDESAYVASTQAIVDLKAYLDKLSPDIKDALEKAPFEVVRLSSICSSDRC